MKRCVKQIAHIKNFLFDKKTAETLPPSAHRASGFMDQDIRSSGSENIILFI
jgi:hypothetical protein